MKTQKVIMKLTKDIMTHFQLEVYSHEIPLYEAAHPDGEVEVISTGAMVVLDFAEEVARLNRKFGNDSETGNPLVDTVYGHGGRQLSTGEFEIDPAVVTNQASVEVPVPTSEPVHDIDTQRELCKVCDIKITKNMNGKTLQKLLDAKRAEFSKVVMDRGIDPNELDMLELKGLIDDISEEEAA